jgi:hypothetical protein
LRARAKGGGACQRLLVQRTEELCADLVAALAQLHRHDGHHCSSAEPLDLPTVNPLSSASLNGHACQGALSTRGWVVVRPSQQGL